MIKKALMTLAMLCAIVAPAAAQPSITSVVETDYNTIEVTFSEAVEDGTGTFSILETVPATGDYDYTDYNGDTMDTWAQTLAGYVSPFTQDIVDNLKSIRDVGVAQGRVEGRMGQFGDSITWTKAYWETFLYFGYYTDMNYHFGYWGSRQCENASWERPGSILDWVGTCYWSNCGTCDAAEARGDLGAESGWTLSMWLSQGHPTTAINGGDYSWATFMLGTNDILSDSILRNTSDLANWRAVYKQAVQDMISMGCIPIISTAPPTLKDYLGTRSGDYITVDELNAEIIAIAGELDLPYIDYNGAIRHNQPTDPTGPSFTEGVSGSWFGNLMLGYDDTNPGGIHPESAGSAAWHSGDNHTDYSQIGLWGPTAKGGYELRTFLSLCAAAKLQDIVFNETSPAEGTSTPATPFNPTNAVYSGNTVTLTVAAGNTLELGKEYTVTATNVETQGGGNPTTSNSAFTVAYTPPDLTPPVLNSTGTATDDNTVVITFDEDIDSTSAANATYVFSPTVTVASASRTGVAEITIDINETFLDGGHTITVTGVEDLSGNVMAAGSTTSFNYTAQADPDAPIIQSAAFTSDTQLEVYYDKELDDANFNANISDVHLYVWDGDSYLDNEVTITSTGTPYDDPTNGWTSVITTSISYSTGNWYVLRAGPGTLMNLSGTANTVTQDIYWAHGDVGATPPPILTNPDAPLLIQGDIRSDNVSFAIACDLEWDPGVMNSNLDKLHLYTWDGDSYLDNEIPIESYGRSFGTVSLSGSNYPGLWYAIMRTGTSNPPLADGYWYILILDPGCLATPGGEMQTEQQFIYWNEGSALPEPTFDDTTPPVFTAASITNLSTIEAVFDEDLDGISAQLLTNWDIYSTGPPAGSSLAITNISVTGATVTITLTTPLDYDTNYTIEATGIQDDDGNAAGLQTQTADSPAAPDLTEPQLVTIVQNSNNSIRATFDEDVQYADDLTDPTWTISPTDPGAVTSIQQVSGDASQYVITFTNAFAYSTLYTVTAPARITDLNNNSLNTSFNSDTFTSSSAPIGITTKGKIFNTLQYPINDKVVTMGVTFRDDEVLDGANIAVVDEDGNDVGPVGVAEVMDWNDGNGYLRFAHVSFPATISASDSAEYYITTERTPVTTSYLDVTETASDYTVDTGYARYVINKTSYRVFDSVTIDPTNSDSYTVNVLSSGNSRGIVINDSVLGEVVAYSLTPTRTEILEDTNARIAIIFEGRLGTPDGLTTTDYRYRNVMYFFAGNGDVKMDLKIWNNRPLWGDSGPYDCGGDVYFNAELTHARNLYVVNGGIELTTLVANGTTEVLLDQSTYTNPAPMSAGENTYVYQDGYWSDNQYFDPTHYNTPKNLQTTGYALYYGTIGAEATIQSSTTANATGAIALSNGSTLNIGAAVRDFPEQGPIGLTAFADGVLSVDLWHADQLTDFPIIGSLGKTHGVSFSFGEPADDNLRKAYTTAELSPAIQNSHSVATSKFIRPFAPRDVSIAAGGDHAEYTRVTWAAATSEEPVSGVFTGSGGTGMLKYAAAKFNMYGKYDWGAVNGGFNDTRSPYSDFSDWNNNEYDTILDMAVFAYRGENPDWLLHSYNNTRQMFDWTRMHTSEWLKKYVTRDTGDPDCWYRMHQYAQHVYDNADRRVYLNNPPQIPVGKIGKVGHSPARGFIFAYYFTGEYDIKEDWLTMARVMRDRVEPVNPHPDANDTNAENGSLYDMGEPRANGWFAGVCAEAWRLTASDSFKVKAENLMEAFSPSQYPFLYDPSAGYTRAEMGGIASDELGVHFNAWALQGHIFMQEEMVAAGETLPAWMAEHNQLWTSWIYEHTWLDATSSPTPYPIYAKYWNFTNDQPSIGTSATEFSPIPQAVAHGIAAGFLTQSYPEREADNFKNIIYYNGSSGTTLQDAKRLTYLLEPVSVEALILGWDRTKTIATFSVPSVPGGDTTPPQTVSANDEEASMIRVIFTENIDPVTGADENNYDIFPTAYPGINVPIDYIIVSGSRADIYLTSPLNFDEPFTIEVINVEDLAGNALVGTHSRFFTTARKWATINGITAVDDQTITISFDEEVIAFDEAVWQVTQLTPSSDTYTVTNVTRISTTELSLTTDKAYPNGAAVLIVVDDVVDTDGNYTVNDAEAGALNLPVSDTDAPTISSVAPTAQLTIDVLFNEDVDQATAEVASNYDVSGVEPTSAVRDAGNNAKVTLTFSAAFASEASLNLTVINVRDLSANAITSIESAFTGWDYVAPTLTQAFSLSRSSIELRFNEPVDPTDAVDTANYRIWETSSDYATSPLSITGIVLSSSNTVIISTGVGQQDVEYTVESDVEDLYGNASLLTTNVFIINDEKFIRVTFSNVLTTEVTTHLEIYIPMPEGRVFVPESGDLSEEFSFEDDDRNSYPAEFIVHELDPKDDSIATLKVIVKITIPASTTIERWVVWGQDSSNQASIGKPNRNTERTFGKTIDNRYIQYDYPNDEVAPAKNLRFSRSNNPIIRDSYYSATIGGVVYNSTDAPTGTTETTGSVVDELIVTSGLSTLEVETKTKAHTDTEFIEINTLITNNTGADMTVESLSLNFEVPHDWSTINYAPNLDLAKTTPSPTSGLSIVQTNSGYQVISDGSTVLVDYSGTGGAPSGDYSGWLAAVGKNKRWYMAVVPARMSRSAPRTLTRTNTAMTVELINNDTIIYDNTSVQYTTFVILDRTPIDVTMLGNISSSITGAVSATVSTNYLNDIDATENPPIDVYVPVIP